MESAWIVMTREALKGDLDKSQASSHHLDGSPSLWLTTEIFKFLQDKPPLSLIFLSGNLIQLTLLIATHIDCSSLEGQRTIDDFFDILDNAVAVGSSNAYVLQKIDDRGSYLTTLYERGDAGILNPGKYVIGELDSINLLALFFIVFQSLRKTEWKISEEK